MDKPKKMNRTENKCVFCGKTYRIKENFIRHNSICELIYCNQKMNDDEWNDKFEKIPDNKELFQLIKILLVKCNTLENEMQKLKSKSNMQTKKHIDEWLNQYTKKPSVSFQKWREQLTVKREDLELVFEMDLTEGIKNVIQRNLQEKNNCLSSFTQKKNTIYVFQEDEWTIMKKDDLEKIIDYLSRQFIKEFIQWQKENEKYIQTSERMKDKEIHYMMKVNGSKISSEKRTDIVKKWLYEKVEQKLEILDI